MNIERLLQRRVCSVRTRCSNGIALPFLARIYVWCHCFQNGIFAPEKTHSYLYCERVQVTSQKHYGETIRYQINLYSHQRPRKYAVSLCSPVQCFFLRAPTELKSVRSASELKVANIMLRLCLSIVSELSIHLRRRIRNRVQNKSTNVTQ